MSGQRTQPQQQKTEVPQVVCAAGTTSKLYANLIKFNSFPPIERLSQTDNLLIMAN